MPSPSPSPQEVKIRTGPRWLTGAAADGFAARWRRSGWSDWPAWATFRPASADALFWVSLLMAGCAAAWFSGGTAADYQLGLLAVAGWLLAGEAARKAGGGPGRRSMLRRPAGQPTAGSTDWLVLPGPGWDGGVPLPGSRRDDAEPGEPPRVPGPRGPGRTAGRGGPGGPGGPPGTPGTRGSPGTRSAGTPALSKVGYLLAVGPVAAEYTVYGGIAAGGEASGWGGMWQLTTMAVIVTALRDAFTASSGRAQTERPSWRRRLVLALRNPPVTMRVLIAVAGLMVHGARVAMFCVLAAETLSLLFAVAGLRKQRARGDGRREPAAPAMILATRDDGPLVRWAGRLVQGNLLPLPPAIAGLLATTLLAMLGMGNLHGIIALTPPVVLLLAAPGASHPHTGRFDWLVPVCLQAAQYLYLSTLGFAWRVPGPAIYALCALTAIWYATLAAPGRRSGADAGPAADARLAGAAGGKRTSIGWEARMFIAGLSAIIGLASFAYIAMAAYLGVLICRKVLAGTLSLVEDNRR